jgi:hypothetical protein
MAADSLLNFYKTSVLGSTLKLPIPFVRYILILFIHIALYITYKLSSSHFIKR